MLYEGEFADLLVYDKVVLECCEANDKSFIGVWKRLDDFGNGAPSLYPEGLMNILLNEAEKRGNN